MPFQFRPGRLVAVSLTASASLLAATAADAGVAVAATSACTVSATLVNSCRPWLGAASGGYDRNGFRATIEYHESRAGRQVDIVHDYLQPNQLPSSDERYLAARADTILLLNWKPVIRWATATGTSASVNSYIDQMADQLKSLAPARIMLNLNHEPENDISAGGAPSCGTKSLRGGSGSAADYVAMWHNVRARFDARGVSNVVWVMNYMGWTNWYCMTRDLWPGNAYVDWLMWDPYPNVATWRSHVGDFYNHLLATSDATHDFTSKPWGLAEYGYKGTSQTAAYQMYADVRNNLTQFPRLRAYCIWDSRNTSGHDVRVLYSSSSARDQKEQDAYNALVHDPSFAGTASSDTQAPTVPTGLTAVAPSATTGVELAWTASTDNVGVTGYTVFRDGTAIGATVATGFRDTAVVAGSSYSYQVAAVDAAGNSSGRSASVPVRVPDPEPDVTPPSVPGGLTATGVTSGGSAVRLSWQPSTDEQAVASYTVLRDGEPLAVVEAPTVTYVDRAVTAGVRYSYSVLATDTSGNSSVAGATVAITAPTPDATDTTPPSSPTGLAVTVSGFVPQLRWNAATDDVAVAGYRVYRGTTLLDTTTALTYRDESAPLGATSSYTVRAIDGAGNVGAASAAATATVPRDTVAPSRVGTLTAVAGAAGSRTITISWTAATDNHRVDRYWLYRGNAKYQQLSGATTSYTDTGLAAGTSYTYKVYALDAANNWGPSSGNVTATAR